MRLQSNVIYPSLKSKISKPSIGVHQSSRGIVRIEAKLKRDVKPPDWSPSKMDSPNRRTSGFAINQVVWMGFQDLPPREVFQASDLMK
jgi:hypothetical protein